jgi:hypothetical protein
LFQYKSGDDCALSPSAGGHAGTHSGCGKYSGKYSGTFSGIDFLPAGSIYSTGNIHIPGPENTPAHFPASIFFLPGQFTALEIKKINHLTNFLRIYINSCSMAMSEIVFSMPKDRPGSGITSDIDSLHAGSIYSTGNQENQPFLRMFFIFK